MNEKARFLISKSLWILSAQFGIDPVRLFRGLSALPWYFATLNRFKQAFAGKVEFKPCLHDRTKEAGSVRGEYFYQDLYVAQKIFKNNPTRHVDIGSRIDGFVAHVASFREIEVLDIRPIHTEVLNMVFKQADLMTSHEELYESCDSLSCLHVLEHFGLGRYGDKIDPSGWELGLRNLVPLLKQQGLLYLSVPFGEHKVEFNGNWVFGIEEFFRVAEDSGLALEEVALFQPGKGVIETKREDLHKEIDYNSHTLAILTFIRT